MGSTVQQVAELGPAGQEPAATVDGGFELGDEQSRVIGPERLAENLDLIQCRDVEQSRAQFLNFLEPWQADLLDPFLGRRLNSSAHVGDLHPLGAFDHQGKPGGLADEVALGFVARLPVEQIASDPLLEHSGIFVGQAGHEPRGPPAMFDCIAAYTGFAVNSSRAGRAFRVILVSLDLQRWPWQCSEVLGL